MTISDRRDIRVAVVFYGGVSLAIYENGVARSFFDLTYKQHVYKLLLEMLNADAHIDVLSGASAGGINAPMLATALEYGSDHKLTSSLWRELADISELMTSPDDGRPDSLLDRNNAFLNRLTTGFHNLILNQGGREGIFHPINYEIDVFVTGTDFHGRVHKFLDGIDSEIEDKDHRAVFHLKHRPGNDPEQNLCDDPKNARSLLGESRKLKTIRDTDEVRFKKTQAAILASVARLTASFPGAFPPFTVTRVEDKDIIEDVHEALNLLADLKKEETNSGPRMYVDGGTLNNRPFRPVLESIFYRMPRRKVERKLFYVEPLPEEFSDKSKFGSQEDETPLKVLFSTGSSIPLHQSIRDNIEYLKKHNAKVSWINKLTEKAKITARNNVLCPETAVIYLNARIECIAKSILLRMDDPPRAEDYVMDIARKEGNKLRIEECLLELLQIDIKKKLLDLAKNHTSIDSDDSTLISSDNIKKITRDVDNVFDATMGCAAEQNEILKPGNNIITSLNSYDIDYLLRKSFYYLYEIYEEAYSDDRQDARRREGKSDYTDKQKRHLADIQKLIGRIIKLLKIVREALSGLRDKMIDKITDSINKADYYNLNHVNNMINRFNKFLEVSESSARIHEPPWNVAAVSVFWDFYGYGRSVGGYWMERWSEGIEHLTNNLNTVELNKLNKSLRDRIDDMQFDPEYESPQEQNQGTFDKSIPTVLRLIEDTLDFIVTHKDSPVSNNPIFNKYICIDAIVFPYQYVSGVLEKDIIKFIRVSPKDAKTGLSNLNPRAKIAGDEIGSFSAFLRRDWRSNDILWGRIDSTCLIIQTLLTDDELEKLIHNDDRRNRIDITFSNINKLRERFEFLPADDIRIKNLVRSWNDLIRSESKEAMQAFRENLILTAQHNIVREDLEAVYEDLYYQEMEWDLIKYNPHWNEDKLLPDPKDNSYTQPGATKITKAEEAQRMAKNRLATLPQSDWGNHFRDMKIGQENVLGENSAIPRNILAEYVTNAWVVLLNMMKVSFDHGGSKRTVFDITTFRWIFLHPIMFAHMMFVMGRRDKILSVIVSTVVATLSLISIIYCVFIEKHAATRDWILFVIVPLAVLYVLFKFNFIRLFGAKGLWGKLLSCIIARQD